MNLSSVESITGETASPASECPSLGLESDAGGVAVEAAPDTTPVGWARAARALAHRDFRYFFVGNLVSNVGTWMQSVAQGWLVLELAHDNAAFWLGLVGFASNVPLLVFSLLGGVIADRINRRRLLIVTQTAMMLFAFVLAGLTWTHLVTMPIVAIVAFATGCAMAMTMPAYQALQGELVPLRDLTNAIALNSAQFQAARAIGPTIGGLGMIWLGLAGSFLLNGISFIAVIFALAAIHYPAGRVSDGNNHIWDDLVEGLQYVYRDPLMRALLTLVSLVALLTIPHLVFIPLFARQVLHLGERGFGLLAACTGMGALVGAVVVAYRHPRRRGRAIISAGMCMCLAVVGFSYSRWPIVSALLLAVAGFCMTTSMSNVNAVLQQLSSRTMCGRVMSLFMCLSFGMVPVGSLLVGSVAKWTGAPHALAGSSALAFIAALVVWITQPTLRALD